MSQNQVPQQVGVNRTIVPNLEQAKPAFIAFQERKGQEQFNRFYIRSPSRIEHISINAAKMATTSTSKIIRISSSGLNAHSPKSSQTQKCLNFKQMEVQSKTSFSQISCSTLLRPSSSQGVLLKQTMETSIELSHYNYYVQLSEKYNRKMIEQFRAQNDYWTAECDHLRKIIRNNEVRAVDLQKRINQLQAKLTKKDKRYLVKLEALQLGLQKFGTFYDRCHQYTIMRISDVQARIESLKQDLQVQFNQNEVCLPKMFEQLKQKFISVIGAQRINNLQIRLDFFQNLSDLDYQTQQIKQKVNELQQSQFKKARISIKNQAISNQIQFFKQIIRTWKHQILQKIDCQQISQLPNSLQLLQNQEISQSCQKGKIVELREKIQMLQKNIESLNSSIRKQTVEDQIRQKIPKESLCKQTKQLQTQLHSAFQIQASRNEDNSLQLEKQKTENKRNLKQKCPKDRIQSYLKLLQQQQSYNLTLQEKIEELQKQIETFRRIFSQIQGKKNKKFQIRRNTLTFSYLGRQAQKQNEQDKKLTPTMMSLINDNQKLRSLFKTMKTQRLLVQQQNKKLKRAISEYINTFQHHSGSFQRKISYLQMQNSTLKSDNQKYSIQNRKLNNLLQNASLHDLDQKNERRIIKSRSGGLLIEGKINKINSTHFQKQAGFIVNRAIPRDIQKQLFSGQNFQRPFMDNNIVDKRQMQTNSKRYVDGLNKLELLKNALRNARFFLPTGCKIDETGYLKHAIYNSYIMDEDGNLIELTRQQQKAAVCQGIITLS